MFHKGKSFYHENQNYSNQLPRNASDNKVSKKARIIVRNLPFKNLSEKSVEDLFKEFGEIEEVKLLRKDDGKFVGCGFVQFKKTNSAAKAIVHCNQKEIYGRKIIVDWALPKDTFLRKVKELENPPNIKHEILSDEENEKCQFKVDTKPEIWNSDNDEEKNDSEDSEENQGSDDDDNEDDDGEDDNDDEEDDQNEEPDDTDEEEEEEEDGVKKKGFTKTNDTQNKSKNVQANSSDVEEGKTLFIRNVPFFATNENLKECFEKYGPLEYALICIDKLTEHSKGTAFVKFKDKESAVNCLKDSMNLYINDSLLKVTTAISKESLENKKKNKKPVKDSRNLYLVREGVVVAGSKSATGVSASDMAKRLQLEQWKTQILKNLNMFISKNRLVIHNLPPSYDDAKLKQLFVKHGNPKAIIKEAKVMRDKKKLDSKGNGVSKEVGFVLFTKHEDALEALRNINNNPNIFTPKKRPIVAFSVENRAVLNAKKKRVEKSRAKLGIVMKDDKLSKLNRKQRRFIKRKQKIIEKRKEAKKLKAGEVSEQKPKLESNVEKSNKRKGDKIEGVKNKKQKVAHSNSSVPEPESSSFAGVISEPGKTVKMRSRFNLKTQANIHMQNLKNEKKRKEKEKKKMISIKQSKQKKGKGKKLNDDAKLSKLISKHRESIPTSTVVKKWYNK